MLKRWALILPLLHLVLAGTWIWQHNASYWAYLPEMQALEDEAKAHPQPSVEKQQGEVGWDPISVDYFIPIEARAIVCINPVPAILAARGYPFDSASFGKAPILRPVALMPVVSRFRVKTRALFWSGVLLVLIGLQWTLLGRRLDCILARVKLTSLLRSPAVHITVLAVIAGLANLLCHALGTGDSFNDLQRYSASLALLSLFLALIVWLIWAVVVVGRFLWTQVKRLCTPMPGART